MTLMDFMQVKMERKIDGVHSRLREKERGGNGRDRGRERVLAENRDIVPGKENEREMLD